MHDERIEIHQINALRVDTAGRVGRVRVIGVADRDDERIHVDLCVADLGYDRRPRQDQGIPAGTSTGRPWENQQAAALARIVDPKRTRAFAGHEPSFLLDTLKDKGEERRRAYLWVAEIDLLLTPAVPPVGVGVQAVPINVRAQYLYDTVGRREDLRAFSEVRPVKEFDAGVLLVHGIGMQRRSETLSQWSAPLSRWITAWLKGAGAEISQKLDPAALDAWRDGLSVRPLEKVDADYVDRAQYANALVRRSHESAMGGWRAEPRTTAARVKNKSEDAAAVDDAVRATCEQTVCRIEELGASAVGGAAEFREAYVLDVGAHGFEPASVEMHVEAMAADGYMLRSRWMLAESHWAETFWAPSFFGFGRWCLLTAPILLVHYVKLAGLRHRNPLRWFVSALGFAVSVTLAQVAFALLTVLWLVPWERLRRFVLRIQLALTGIVGDSYVLLQDPVQRRAIIDRVQRDLQWLLQRCESVVVIAHSQGAYVAKQVLESREDVEGGRVDAFATLGSGLQTLSAIETIARDRKVNIAGWAMIGCVFLLGLAGAIALSGRWPLAGVLAAAALFGIAYATKSCSHGRPTTIPFLTDLPDWLDLFAAKDLVPYGPLIDPDNRLNRFYTAKEVRNRDSLLGDHVLYWQNFEQVVGRLARLVGGAASFKPLTELLPDDAATLERLERARLSRLGFLRVGRGAALLATALLLYAHWSDWVAIGFWAVVWAQSKLGFAIAALPAPGLRVWLQAALVVVPWVVYKTLVNATFDAWTNSDVERLLRRSAGKPATHWTVVFTVVVLLTIAGPVIYLLPGDTTWMALGVTALLAIALAALAQRTHAGRVGRVA